MTRPSKPTVIVLGMMGWLPFAGVAWQVLHYLESLRRLGYDTYYIEDNGEWPYDPQQDAVTSNCRYTISYIARLMDWLGLTEHWAYRAAAQSNQVFGLSAFQLAQLLKQADALINLTGATVLREEHLKVPVRIYLETDPVLPQIEVAQGRSFTINLLSAHTHHFTYGENLGAPDCRVPVERFNYCPTRQPVILDWWQAGRPGTDDLPRPANGQHSSAHRFTTIASWQQSEKDIQWNGEVYAWSKHHEFLKFIDLPRRTSAVLELALACGDKAAIELLESHGWHVLDALRLSESINPYRDYILNSDGEFTVAKDQNIRLRSGWFSDRSACYLAAGKPVITQDTGFGNMLPTGRGLFAFRNMEDILTAFDTIASDYTGNCRAAQEIAVEYFSGEKVLRDLLSRAGL